MKNAPFRRVVPRPASLLLPLCGLLLTAGCRASDESASKQAIEELVWQHAKAWETGDAALFERLIHPDIVFAYPGGRLGKSEIMGSFNDFARDFKDTRVYVHKTRFYCLASLYTVNSGWPGAVAPFPRSMRDVDHCCP